MDSFRKVSVAEEFRRNPDLRKEDIEEIQEWMDTQEHLPKITDSEIILFLHSNYYNVQASKDTIVKYFNCRTQYKEFFSNLNLSSDALVQAGENITLAVLPKKSYEGHTVVFGKLWSLDPAKFNVVEDAKVFTMLIDSIHLQEGTQSGLILCFDMEGLLLSHIFRISIFAVKHYLYYLQEAMPIRMKKIHFFNVVSFVDKILALVRPFMKQSLFDILAFHDKIDTVHSSIPAEAFPSDYPNGKAKTREEFHESFYKDLLKLQDYFTMEEETRRIEKQPRKSFFGGWFSS